MSTRQNNILTLGLVLIYLSGFIFAQLDESKTKKEKILLNENDRVYVIPGEKIFHLETCKKLSDRKTGMSLKYAIERGYKPCPICIPIEKKIEKRAKEKGTKTREQIKKEEAGEIPLSKTGFRLTRWGMSKAQVKNAESSKFIREEKLGGAMKGLECLVCQDNIAGLDCLIVYYFAENRLTRARYLFTEDHSNNNLYISDFEIVKSQLSQKYGQPIRDELIWSNDLYKDDSSHYGMAIAIGHLQYVVEWSLPETYIQVLLQGDNFKINHWVEYIGKAFRKFEENAREKAQKSIW